MELVAAVAAALHHAHSQGLFHRDIKPNNILLDHSGRAFVADFGLALDEQDVGGKSARVVGTYAYMSPEQARGEAYRVDGRSDIFSLGIVMYELLTGRRPFRGDSRELLDQIQTVNVRPLRQIDDRIPRELERICLTALAKRPADRYATAGDMADALREFLSQGPAQAQQRTAQEWTQPARTAQDRSITPDRTPVPAPEKSDAPSASAMNPPVTGAFRIALLYKRFAQPDEELLRYLEKEFKARRTSRVRGSPHGHRRRMGLGAGGAVIHNPSDDAIPPSPKRFMIPAMATSTANTRPAHSRPSARGHGSEKAARYVNHTAIRM